ncbi:murein biosynthesis integral membrane protein MurJ [Cellulomonas uda]|uniref:Membrane protein n=1 Tax=Cellulomonas uda TaxID=1714 RepID=A0A4Y3KCJ6_CELUD|nr:lipid II flippase MurJ [Cellulomonas uda]NII66062.1 putative peptidoglycan lipid II flippase [Cellulomonas uda]GEA81094.1 membrane protein [Cellulomonas uda]
MSPQVRRALGGLAGAAAMIAAVTVLSRLLGFARWLLQASQVGDGAIGDAYNSANLLPNVLFEVAAGGALAGALIPLLAAPIARGDRREVERTASGALGWTLLVLGPLALLLAALASPVAQSLAHTPDQVALIRFFILVFAVQVPMYGVAVLLYAVLQAHKRFFWPAFAPVISSLVVMATYLVYGALADGERSDPDALAAGALEALAWGTTLGVAAMCLPMFVPVHRLGVRLRVSLRFPEGVGPRLLRLALAGVGSVAAQQLALLVVMRVAWWQPYAEVGTFTRFLYTQQVYLLPYAVLVVPLATSTFPRLAARASAGDRAGFATMAAVTTRAVLVAAGVGVAVVVAAAPAVATVFAHIAGNAAIAGQMGLALTWMMPGLAGFALLFHVSRSLYALERGRAAAAANVLGWGTVALAAVVLVRLRLPDGGAVVSIAAASTVGMLVAGAIALVLLRRAAGPGALLGLARTTAVLVAGVGVAAVVGRWVADAVQDVAGHGVWTALGAGAGGATLALAVVAAVVGLADRSTVLGVLRADRSAAPAAQWSDSPRAGGSGGGDVG